MCTKLLGFDLLPLKKVERWLRRSASTHTPSFIAPRNQCGLSWSSIFHGLAALVAASPQQVALLTVPTSHEVRLAAAERSCSTQAVRGVKDALLGTFARVVGRADPANCGTSGTTDA